MPAYLLLYSGSIIICCRCRSRYCFRAVATGGEDGGRGVVCVLFASRREKRHPQPNSPMIMIVLGVRRADMGVGGSAFIALPACLWHVGLYILGVNIERLYTFCSSLPHLFPRHFQHAENSQIWGLRLRSSPTYMPHVCIERWLQPSLSSLTFVEHLFSRAVRVSRGRYSS